MPYTLDHFTPNSPQTKSSSHSCPTQQWMCELLGPIFAYCRWLYEYAIPRYMTDIKYSESINVAKYIFNTHIYTRMSVHIYIYIYIYIYIRRCQYTIIERLFKNFCFHVCQRICIKQNDNFSSLALTVQCIYAFAGAVKIVTCFQ